MWNLSRQSFAIGRVVALLILAACLATPASAQFGGLKKKLKAAATGPAAAPASAPGRGDGSVVVLTADAVDRLIAGIKAGKAERVAATKEDTPYGRHIRAVAAYDAAKTKCAASQQAGIQRIAENEKTSAKYSAFVEKLAAAQQKQDYALSAAYSDSALAMIDPSCAVHEPKRPDDYYDLERAVDARAEQAILKTADLTATEFGQTSDRVIAILAGNTPPGDASPAEKSAVTAKSAELKPLLGMGDPQEVRSTKPAPAAAAAPAAAPAPAVPAGVPALNDCMVQNAQKHEAEIQALGSRGDAANKAGNTPLMMAIADSVNRIMMAGCTVGR
jgi:hypothetical protein